MKKIAITAAVILAASIALSGCAALGPQPTTWLATDSGNVDYLSWTNTNGTLSGTAQLTEASTGGSGDPATSSTEQVSGTESSGNITLRFGGSILGTSLSGTIDNQTLTLNGTGSSGPETITFHPGSFNDYKSAISRLAATVTKSRNTAAAAAMKAQITSDIASLSSEQTDVSNDGKTVQADVAKTQTDQTTQRGYANAALASKCYQNANVSDEGTAFYDLQSDSDTLSGDLQTLQADLSTLNGTLTGLSGSFGPSLITSKGRADIASATTYAASATKYLSAQTTYNTQLSASANSVDTEVNALPYC